MPESYISRFVYPLESIEGNNALRSRLLDIRDVMSELRTFAVLGFIIDPLRLVRSTAIAKALPAAETGVFSAFPAARSFE
jgi:hypothetical protein